MTKIRLSLGLLTALLSTSACEVLNTAAGSNPFNGIRSHNNSAALLSGFDKLFASSMILSECASSPIMLSRAMGSPFSNDALHYLLCHWNHSHLNNIGSLASGLNLPAGYENQIMQELVAKAATSITAPQIDFIIKQINEGKIKFNGQPQDAVLSALATLRNLIENRSNLAANLSSLNEKQIQYILYVLQLTFATRGGDMILAELIFPHLFADFLDTNHPHPELRWHLASIVSLMRMANGSFPEGYSTFCQVMAKYASLTDIKQCVQFVNELKSAAKQLPQRIYNKIEARLNGCNVQELISLLTKRVKAN